MAVSIPKLCMFFTLQFKDDLGKSLPSHQSGPKALPKVLEPEGTLNDELSTREPGQDLVQAHVNVTPTSTMYWYRASTVVQSNVTYPDATYPSTSDIRQWGVLNNFDSLTYKT